MDRRLRKLGSESNRGAGTTSINNPQSASSDREGIAAHYFAHEVWLEDGILIRNADRLAGIPGVLIRGRFDPAAPLGTAWALHRRWPDSELLVVEDSGHTGSRSMTRLKRDALNPFAGK
ncbi:alpha/beta fold hydrolase (plasmid) [Haloferacaceae archaeon DSL9]